MDDAHPLFGKPPSPGTLGHGGVHPPQSAPSVVLRPLAAPRRYPGFRRHRDRLIYSTPMIWIGALALGAWVASVTAVVNPVRYSATGLLLGLGADPVAIENERTVAGSDEVLRGMVGAIGVSRLAPACAAQAGPAAFDCAVRWADLNLQTQLLANSAQSGALLRVTATHADPAIAAAMVAGAADADRALWRLAHGVDQAAALAPQLTTAEAALSDTQQQIAKVRADGHVTAIMQDLATAMEAVSDVAQRNDQRRLRQVAVDAQLAVAQLALRTAPATVLDSREISIGDPGQDSRLLLMQLKLQRAHIAELYTPDYPGLAELDHKIETVERTMKGQSNNASTVSRDIRNPLLASLSLQAASLDAERAGLIQQGPELQHVAASAAAREVELRGVEARLTDLGQRHDVQAATVRQLSTRVTELRAQDAQFAAQLEQRRLVQRPVAVAVPWTGHPASIAAGSAVALLYGVVVTIIARRRRSMHAVLRQYGRAIPRLAMTRALPADDFAPQSSPRLFNSLAEGGHTGLGAMQRNDDIKSLGAD